ncbi:aminotransferase class V-fold PLP-dependent enzyme, partial [Staphylococcus capitis]|uniref:aminotransferase class V-fold PLP-dependent enzyme n=1 Tax=Staphylococcus capitis TaxID=29388 RepID=UPI003709C1BA
MQFLTKYHATSPHLPTKFQAPTPLIPQPIPLTQPIPYIQHLPFHPIHNHHKHLTHYPYHQISPIEALQIYPPPKDPPAALITF